MLDRLWFRLLLGMSLALAVAVGTVALLMRAATEDSFDAYVENVSSARSSRVENVLTRVYQRNRGWSGVGPTIQLVADLSGQRVVLADNTGQVVADSQSALVGQRVRPDWAREPIIITYQEKPVGSVYLDPLRPANQVDNRGQAFLSVTGQYLVWAAAVGLLAALILSLLLARWLAAPLEALTGAARRMERGDLGQRIEVRIGGEVGALARAFNSTAASLSRLEGLRRQMVTDIAHELRTPLTNIRGYLEAIQDGVVEPDGETLGIIQHELTQLTRLVDDLQELALVEAGQLALTRQELDLRDLVALELRTVRPQADVQGVELVADLAPDLPLVSVDAGRLAQALGNILRNALTHTPRGGRIIASVAAAHQPPNTGGFSEPPSIGGQGGHPGQGGAGQASNRKAERPAVVIRIRDTGAGIPSEHLPHIFERFYRGDKARARQGHGGYGLGLTIARELVQAHHGQIAVRSTLGEGTEFAIRLPLAAAPEVTEAAPPEAAPVAVARRAGRLTRLRTGVLVSGLFGAVAGLVETGLLAVGVRKGQSFLDFFGYAVLIDALVFGAFGALATVLGSAAARLFGGRLDLARLVAMLAPIGCLLVGMVAHLRWRQLFSRDDSISAPQAIFAQIVIFGAAAWLALLAGALLAPRRGPKRALVFGQRLAPVALAILVGVSGLAVLRDLGSRGFGSSIASATAAGQPEAAPAAGEAGGPAASVAASPVAAADPPLASEGGQGSPRRPNVLVVTVESLRADHVGADGYAKARTPTLDRLAAEGVRFANAIANQPDTNAAHAAVFTGTYPATHSLRSNLVDRLPSDLPTMAESFAEHGYLTAGLFSWLSLEPAASGLGRGFQVYTDLTVNRPAYLDDSRASTLASTYQRLKAMLALPGAVDQSGGSEQVAGHHDGKADVTTDGAISWLEQYRARPRASGQPFFLWVHYFDPHYPYTPPPPFDQVETDDCADCLDGGPATIRMIAGQERPELSPAQINRLLQYYDGEIAFTDRELGRLLQVLRGLGLEQDTLVVVLGTHGASFGEHDRWLHGDSLHDPEVHVPLLFRFPGRLPAGRVVDAVAQQIDVLPTIFELLELPPPPRAEGRTLLPLIRDLESGQDRYAIAELGDRSAISIVTRDWRLVKNTQDGSLGLYRTLEDPDSLQDQADAEPEIVAALEHVLQQWRAAHP